MSEQQRARRRRQRQRRRQRRRDDAPEIDAPEAAEADPDGDPDGEPEPAERESRVGERVLGDPPPRPNTIFGMPRMVFALSVGIFAALLVVIVLGQIIEVDDDLEGVTRFPDQGRRHLTPGEVFTDYNSNPPTSGPQDPAGVPPGVYGPDEPAPSDFIPPPAQLLPVLEAGGVVIHYHPDRVNDVALNQLRNQVLGGTLNIVLTANPDIDSAIAVTAWTHLLAINEIDDDFLDQIATFIAGEDVGFYLRFVLETNPEVIDLGSPQIAAPEESDG